MTMENETDLILLDNEKELNAHMYIIDFIYGLS